MNWRYCVLMKMMTMPLKPLVMPQSGQLGPGVGVVDLVQLPLVPHHSGHSVDVLVMRLLGEVAVNVEHQSIKREFICSFICSSK